MHIDTVDYNDIKCKIEWCEKLHAILPKNYIEGTLYSRKTIVNLDV